MHSTFWSRASLTILLTLASFGLAACEGRLGIEGISGPSGGPPVLMPSADAGLVSSDAYWHPPDAYVPPSCTPQCAGRACGPDGCGGSCGACAAGATCNASYQCESLPPTGGGSGSGGTHAVTLYGTSSCGYCIRARQFFRDNAVNFADRDLGDPSVVDEAFERVHALTGEYRLATPTIIIDDHVMLGWSEAQCRSDLGL